MSKDIQEQLKEAIRKSEMSCYRISQLAGVTESQLSLFLNHQRSLTLDSAAKIAEILDLEIKSKGGVSMKRHKYRKGEPTATFEELSFKEQAQSFTATISVLSRMIDNHLRRAGEEGRNIDDVLDKRIRQVQRMIDRKK